MTFPKAVPPSSNDQSMSRLSSPHGLRLPPGPVPLTARRIGEPSVPSVGIVSIATVGAMLFASRFPRSTFWPGALRLIGLIVFVGRSKLKIVNGPSTVKSGPIAGLATTETAKPTFSVTPPLTSLVAVSIGTELFNPFMVTNLDTGGSGTNPGFEQNNLLLVTCETTSPVSGTHYLFTGFLTPVGTH